MDCVHVNPSVYKDRREILRGRGVVAFVFPGQGSQVCGMGQALAEAFTASKEVFQEADDALGLPAML